MQQVIKIPYPMSKLNPNRTKNRWELAAAKKSARKEAWALCKAARLKPMQGPLDVFITFYPPDKRRRDDDNAIAAFKAYRDGIADAIKVDDAEWRVKYKMSKEPLGYVEVVLTSQLKPDPN